MHGHLAYAWTKGESLWREQWLPWKDRWFTPSLTDYLAQLPGVITLHMNHASCPLFGMSRPYDRTKDGVFNPDAPILEGRTVTLDDVLSGAVDGVVLCGKCLYGAVPPTVWVDRRVEKSP